MQESAVHQHSSWPTAGRTNPYGKRQVRITRYGGPGRVGKVWCDNRIEIIGGECVIDSPARSILGVRSRGNINGDCWDSPWSVRQLRRPPDRSKPTPAGNALVEIDQVSQRSHVCVTERCEVVRDLRFEFIQQRGELVIGICEYVTRIGIHDGRTQAFHHIQRVLRKRDRSYRLECRCHSNCNRKSERRVRSARLECAALQELRVVRGQLSPITRQMATATRREESQCR